MSVSFFTHWNREEHKKYFNVWNKISRSYFNFLFGCYYENNYLLNYLKKNSRQSILDVGCATGYLLRYLKLKKTKFDYHGADISIECIDTAKKHYKDYSFTQISSDGLQKSFNPKSFDIVYSRDVAIHQLKPLNFIKDLIDISRNVLVLRIRTRDKGKTVYDPNYSCQLGNQGVGEKKDWVPVIVLNYQELIEFLKQMKIVKKVIVNKSYTILGGKSLLFFEKDLYLKETGGAETSLILFLDREKNNNLEVEEHTQIEGNNYLDKNKFKHYFYKLLNKIYI
tara:strand:+ start:168 stop:1010 length:843 start_codon:yes stop_codon:yes gene_type:complete